MYAKAQFAKTIDQTLLRPECTAQEVELFLREARQHHFASAYVLPCWVRLAVRELEGSDVKVGSVIGFPLGGATRRTKVFEARELLDAGARELDMVINIGRLRSGEYEAVRREIEDVVASLSMLEITDETHGALLKVIIETAYLTRSEIETACKIAADAGADFVKTSTGMGPAGASVEHVRLMRAAVGPEVGVKAAGGIDTVEKALAMLDAGANRIGTSHGIQLLEAYNPPQ
jgi:deoxyribose-phosphate aldolase